MMRVYTRLGFSWKSSAPLLQPMQAAKNRHLPFTFPLRGRHDEECGSDRVDEYAIESGAAKRG